MIPHYPFGEHTCARCSPDVSKCLWSFRLRVSWVLLLRRRQHCSKPQAAISPTSLTTQQSAVETAARMT